MTDIGKIRKADIGELVRILGKKLALNVKEQLGEKYDETQIKEQRRGQQSLMDY